MNHSYWLIIIFIASLACYSETRPQDDRVKNNPRQEPEESSPSRYDKYYFLFSGGRYRRKRDSEPVAFVRIDVPYNKTRDGTLRSIGDANETESEPEEEIRYVPISISTKTDNTKKWPGHTGLETVEDLNFYEAYTNSVNDKIKPGNPNQVVPYVYNNKKPAIIIIEELTTRRPFYDKPSYPTNDYTYTPIDIITYRPEGTRPSYFGSSFPGTPFPVTTPRPYYPSQTVRPVMPQVLPARPEQTKCPSVTITATNTVVNNNKEGCNDIKIHIESGVHNKINGSGLQNDPLTVTPVVSVTERPEEETLPLFGGIGDFFGSALTTFSGLALFNPLSLTLWSTLFSPLLILIAGGVGAAALIIPCAIFSGRNQGRNRFVILRNRMDKPKKYVYGVSPDGNKQYLKRTTSGADVTSTEGPKGVANIEAIAVVARATSDRPIGRAPESDIRTPPKLKEIIQGKIQSDNKRKDEAETERMAVDRIEANGRFELPEIGERASSLPYAASGGKPYQKRKEEDIGIKGVAVPVSMDDIETELTPPPKKLQKIPEVSRPVKEEKKKANPKPVQSPTTTPSSGLSTWILLSDNRDATTFSPKKSNKKETSKPEKTVATTKKPAKVQTTTFKPVTQKATLVTKKGVATPKPELRKSDNESMSALEAMVKNQKKKAEEANATKKATTVKPTRINDRMDVELEMKKPSTIPNVFMTATPNPTTVGLPEEAPTATTTDRAVETTTKKKKSGNKKKKKNKNRRRKPGNETEIEQKNVTKNPKQPQVGAQLYNFLSREIMPTVGLGLVGVLVTAGLAGLLGYNPFVSGNLPVRRTYEIQHGYSPNSYYNYNTEYNDGGQSEEALFREVLSGMPEGSRYGLSNAENSYPESQIYNSQDQVYDAMKGQNDKKFQGGDTGQYQYPESKTDEGGSYDASYPPGYTGSYAYDPPEVLKTRDDSEKYPIYDREVSASYVYPEGTQPEKASRLNEEYDGMAKHADSSNRYGSDKLSSKYSKDDTIERQPEALYRVAGDYDHSYRSESTVQGVSSQNSWHRMGSAMDYGRYSRLEPGPRSLNLTKEIILKGEAKKRVRRSADLGVDRASRKQANLTDGNDIENEIDLDGSVDDYKKPFPEPATEAPQPEDAVNQTTEPEYDVIETNPIPYNFLEILKRLAQFKLKIGLSFLKSTTDAFSRYLDVIQKRVDESITNTTAVYRIRRNPPRSKRSTIMKKPNKKEIMYKRKMDRNKKVYKKN